MATPATFPSAPPSALRRQCQRGVTILELMIVVVLVGILATIGFPAYGDFVASQRVRAAASALYDSLLLARSEAVKRNTSVTMVVTDLASGWTIKTADGVTTLREQEGFSALTFSPANPAIAYNSYGRLTSGGGLEITVTSSATTKSRCITVDVVGRPHTSDGACS